MSNVKITLTWLTTADWLDSLLVLIGFGKSNLLIELRSHSITQHEQGEHVVKWQIGYSVSKYCTNVKYKRDNITAKRDLGKYLMQSAIGKHECQSLSLYFNL